MKLIKTGKFAFNGIHVIDVHDGVELTDDQIKELIDSGWAMIEDVVINDVVAKKGKRGWWTVTIDGVTEKVRAKSEYDAIEQAKIEIEEKDNG